MKQFQAVLAFSVATIFVVQSILFGAAAVSRVLDSQHDTLSLTSVFAEVIMAGFLAVCGIVLVVGRPSLASPFLALAVLVNGSIGLALLSHRDEMSGIVLPSILLALSFLAT